MSVSYCIVGVPVIMTTTGSLYGPVPVQDEAPLPDQSKTDDPI